MSRSIQLGLSAFRTVAARPARALPATQLPLLRRPLSTSPIRLLATPQTGPSVLPTMPPQTPGVTAGKHALDWRDEGSRHAGETLSGHGASDPLKDMEEWKDYSKGPSAIEKASQMFFMTEILRGE